MRIEAENCRQIQTRSCKGCPVESQIIFRIRQGWDLKVALRSVADRSCPDESEPSVDRPLKNGDRIKNIWIGVTR